MPAMPSLEYPPPPRPNSVSPSPPFSSHSVTSAQLYPSPQPTVKSDNGTAPSTTPSDSQPPALISQTSFSLFPLTFPRSNSLTTSSIGPSPPNPSNLPPFLRQLTNPNRPTLLSTPSLTPQPDWRSHLTIEERLTQRSKLMDAYRRQCPTYEALVEVVVAVEEELLFGSSVGRLEYFKSGIDWEARLRMKKGQLGLAGEEADKRSRDEKEKGDNKGEEAETNGQEESAGNVEKKGEDGEEQSVTKKQKH